LSLARPLRDIAYRATVTGRTSAGDPVFSEPVPFRCHYEKHTTFVRAITGEQVTVHHALITLTRINPTDRIWLDSDTSAARAHRPVTVNSATSLVRGQTLYEVRF
jgi:hypothetical protein